METVHSDRLTTLAKFLESLPEEKFDLEDWVLKKGDEQGCGTVACACGWSGLMPEFQAQGLRLAAVLGETDYVAPSYLGFTGRDAAQAFFGLCHWQFDRLFLEIAYPTDERGPKDVARRIRAFASSNFKAQGALTP